MQFFSALLIERGELCNYWRPGKAAGALYGMGAGVAVVVPSNGVRWAADRESGKRREAGCLHVRYVSTVSGPRADTELYPLYLDSQSVSQYVCIVSHCIWTGG